MSNSRNTNNHSTRSPARFALVMLLTVAVTLFVISILFFILKATTDMDEKFANLLQAESSIEESLPEDDLFFSASAVEQPSPDVTEIPTSPSPEAEAPSATPQQEAVDSALIEKQTSVSDAIARNSDVIGLLEVGADISLFVVQGDDNKYYLDHNVDKEYSWTGAAFLDYRSQVSPRSDNWIIHGHNMQEGSIFSNLTDFYDLDYLKEHPFVYFTTSDSQEIYVIYAVLDVEVDSSSSNYFKITEFDFDNEIDFKEYTSYYRNNSFHSIPVYVQPGDELLTLSTCSYTLNDGRLLICCRKLREGETPNSLFTLVQDAS